MSRCTEDLTEQHVHQLFDALKFYHWKLDLVHCDIEPKHIGVSGGDIRILDCGCSRTVGSNEGTMHLYSGEARDEYERVQRVVMLAF